MPTTPILHLPAKAIRADIVAAHVARGHYAGVVCLTCGNAAAALRTAGLDVLEIGPRGLLSTSAWLTPADVHRLFPARFDATPGHLPLPLLVQLADALAATLDDDLPRPDYVVPTGSGETIVALRLAFPHIRFTPLYGLGPSTRWEPDNPLNMLAGDAAPPGGFHVVPA